MKTIRIKLNENGICIGIDGRLKRDINYSPVMEADYQINQYPEDFVGNMQRYIVTEVDGEVVFTMRDRYDEYEAYLENFDYGEDFENTPDSYEVWYAAL